MTKIQFAIGRVHMPTYYALTTDNAQALGWVILASALTRREAETRGRAHVLGTDTCAQTRRDNLRVVSRTAAIRRYGLRHLLACSCCPRWYDDQIVVLRDEAMSASDRAQVTLCNRALAGDAAAIEECMRVLAEARAQG